MPKIAIDVVLFPNEAMTDTAIAVNREIAQKFSDKISLNKENAFPHISLCMGVIDEADVPAVAEILKTIAQEFSVMNLTAEFLQGHRIPTGEVVAGFDMQNNKDLQLLHESICRKLARFLTYDVFAEMLFTPPAIEEITFSWIKNYPEHSSFAKFNPHITVGVGDPPVKELPIQFTASRLALCQLGNYCTCRKVLAETELPAR